MDSKIQWFTRGVELPALDYPLLDRWIAEVAQSYGRIVGSLSYMFCDDEEILKVNREFLNHDYYTDIITFDDCRGKLLRGDMVISLDTVRSNSELQNVSYESELLRVIIHGVLHLCGINDKGPGEREIMENNENRALTLYSGLLNHSAR
ncbi:MAG: rRNA maturation RNase YbeY [Bacteroidales bacterium]|nr:rRNA maturation RNase YbeY [Bacteroidales bacterium]